MNYGEIPVAPPPGAKFAHAMLTLIGNGPLVPGAPDRIFVALEQGGRVFIVSEKLATGVPPIPACDAAGAEFTKKADEIDGAFMRGGGKNKNSVGPRGETPQRSGRRRLRVLRRQGQGHARVQGRRGAGGRDCRGADRKVKRPYLRWVQRRGAFHSIIAPLMSGDDGQWPQRLHRERTPKSRKA